MVSKDLVAATSNPLILSILATGESYGYEIIKRVRELSADQLAWTDGMLYPVLHRLQNQGFVTSFWRTGDNGRRRKYYRITPSGTQELGQLREQWNSVHSTLMRAWDQLEE